MTPVLAVPHQATFQGFKNMVFATDFENKDIDSIGLLIEVAKHFNSHIEVVHIMEADNKAQAKQDQFDDYRRHITEQYGYEKMDFKLLQWDKVEQRLSIFLKESDADLLALVSKSRSFVDRLFTSSLTKKMAYHTHIPLLAF